MAVVPSTSQADRINAQFDALMEKLGGVPGAVRSVLEQDLRELRGSVTELLHSGSDGESAARIKDWQAEAVEALRQSEQFNRQLVESSSDSIKVLDLDGRLVSINSGGLHLLEAENSASVIGRNWVTFWQEEDRPRVQAAVEAACGGQVSTFQAARKSFQGTELWWDVVISPIRGAGDQVERLLVVSRNITERKQAEDELKRTSEILRESEGRFRAMADGTPVMIWVHSADGMLEFVNRAWTDYFGVTLEEVEGTGWMPLVHPDDAPAYIDGFRKSTEEHTFFHAAARVHAKDGTWRWIESQGQPRLSDTGEFLGMAGSSIDITEQKRIEAEREALVEELRVQKDLLERLVEFSPIAISMLKGPEHRFVLVNPAQRALFPTIDEYVGRTVKDVWPDSKEVILPVLDDVFRTAEPFNATDVLWLTDKGNGPEEAYYSFSYTPLYAADGTIEGILVLSKETTEQVRIRQRLEEELEERKQAEAALEKAHTDLVNERNRLMAVMEALPVGLAIYNEKGGVTQANPGFEAVWGSPRPPVNSLDDYDMYKAWWVQTGKRVQPEEWASAQSVITGETQIGQYLRIQRFDGKTGYVLNSGAPIRNAAGEIIGGAVAIMDITERVEMEQALLESQNRFRVALSSVPLLVYTCDRDQRYTWVYNSLNGFKIQDVLGKRDDEVLPPQAAAELVAVKQQALDTGQGGVSEIKMAFDHEDRYYILTTDPIRNAFGAVTGLTCSAIDITEQKRLEIERQEVQMKIEVQRRLMDQREKERMGIARDIHDGPIQTLASTAFNIQFLKESFPDPTLTVELNQIALNVKSAVRELREVVNDLRPPSIIRFGLARAIMMHAEDLRERYPETELELDLDEQSARLSDQACLTVFRVFQEGMNNIFRHAGASKVQVKYTVTGSQFVLEMRDNGGGFAVPKDFTNLTIDGHYGLAGMKERVEAVGGTFTITSQPGKGTTITVKGPLVEAK